MVWLILAIAVVLLLATIYYGQVRWQRGTRLLRARLEQQRQTTHLTHYDPAQLEAQLATVPAVVRRYLTKVLCPGQPLLCAVNIRHVGKFNMAEQGERWRAFSSSQRVIIERPGFDWAGRIALMPGLVAYVHDAYVAREGMLHASLLGLWTVASQRGTADMAQGELLRFLAESPWYPSALLPSRSLHWLSHDDHSAKAHLQDGALEVSLLFRFGDDALVTSVYAEARARVLGNTQHYTPWEGRFFDYQRVAGMLIPMQGEVAWLLESGRHTYWQGRITAIDYETSDSSTLA